ncbi:MAG: hypothetical protein QNJ60_20680 [Xenococcaceae cyanobacterium MO_188.B19]|nr:hypothetical protein [Xenococcaceae cyanobacterium MO_188.B19]
MNWNLSLFKILSLLTLTGGLLIPTNIAEAASSSPKESYTKTDVSEKASDHGGHEKPVKISQILLSKKAQKIEFFSLLGLIGASLVIPEMLGKSSKKSQKNSQSLHSNKEENLQQTPKNQNEPDISYLQEILKDTKKIEFPSNNLVKLEDHKKNALKNEHNQNQKIS